MFPLRWTRSIKAKFSIVIVSAIGVAVITSQVGYALGWPIWLRPLLAVAVSLVLVQFLSHGMTSPLRTMTSAAKDIARGDYGQRIDTPSVDEVGQLAAAFNSMAANLAIADRQRRDLIANVSHELRTPIAGLKAMLENLVDGVSMPTPSSLTTMHGRVERLHRLVEDLLDLSRLEAGTILLVIAPVSVSALVEGAVEECLLDRSDARITVSVPPDLMLPADPERLHQVVLNLLDNAVRHGRGPVHVEATVIADDVRLTVSDCGPGLPLDAGERAFERFYRADEASPNADGIGLGLSIVRWITELHGGHVSVTNLGPPAAPTGARFTVLLPRT